MKILRLSTFLDFGGIETKMVNLSTIRDDNEWIFCALGKGGTAEKKMVANQKKVVCLNLNHKIPSVITIWKLYHFLKKERPDVVHTSGAEANFHGLIAAKLARVPRIIVEEIGVSNSSRKAVSIFRNIFKSADYVVGESQIVVQTVKKKYELPQQKLRVIYNFGIFNLNHFTRKVDIDNFRIIMISRLEPVKNIEGVLNVLARLAQKRKNVKVTIAGSGTLENKLKDKVKELDLVNNVEFVGFITDPYPHLLNADLYILNSHSEGFSNSLVEAMYSKTPSLSTAVGAAPEIIEDGINGFLTPANDEEALYEKIKAILALPKEKLQEIGVAGHEKIVKNFSLENHVHELMKIYTHT